MNNLTFQEFARDMDEQFKAKAADDLRILEKRYKETKDGNLLLEALYLCSKRDLPIPAWCRGAYISAYEKVRFYQVQGNSWNEAFGRPYPKGTKLPVKREHLELNIKVYLRIREILDSEPGTPVDNALFDRVADEFGWSNRTIQGVYYKVKNYRPPY